MEEQAKDGTSRNAQPEYAQKKKEKEDNDYVRNRVAIGFFFFIFWLFLFFLGMSVQAVDLKILDYHKNVIWTNFFIYAFTFTPTNTAMLAATAGILGGVASNLSASNEKNQRTNGNINLSAFEKRSLYYMKEHPLVSMFRGFLAFLILVAGSYIANFSIPVDANNPSTILGMSASSYFKFAVTVSLLSYLVGYDPTQLERLIGSLNIGDKKSANIEGHVDIKDGDHKIQGDFTAKAVVNEQIETPSTQNPSNSTSGLNGKTKAKEEADA